MKTIKKIVAILAVALMLCSILPLSVFAADDTTITFALGANGSASHNDGSTASTYKQEVNGYTLSITNGTQFYTGARDAKGNSCLKLGSSKNTGSFKFTVPDDVTSVIIYAAKYKSNTSKLTVNGTTTTLTKNSNDGAYDAITVDTSSTKTVTVASASGGIRVMINTIEFVIPAAEGSCEHEWELISSTAATCTTAGEEYYECAAGCGETKTVAIDALGHSYGDAVETVAPSCTNEGEQESTCGRCGDVKTETVKALGHTWVDGYCDVCGEEKPLNATITFDANKTQRVEFGSNSQKWENDGLVLINNKTADSNTMGDYSNPIRIYKSSEIVIEFANMTSLVIDVTDVGTDYLWDATLTNAGLSFTVKDKIYTITFTEPTNSITLTAANQVRANSITAYGVKACEHVYDHEFDTDCNNCGEIRDVVAPIIDIKLSISEDVNGLAFRFEANVAGFAVKAGTFVQADYTNATYNGYKLIETGAIASNGNSTIEIKGERMCDLDENGKALFAYRIINIPAENQGDEITMTPYYIVEIEGEIVTIYGEAQVGAYAEVAIG